MTATGTGTGTMARPGRVRRALGLPATGGHGRFITGNLIDSLGNGMLLPLGLLYFTTIRDLPLAAVGAAVTIGQLAALPVVFVAGRFMDRRDPRRLTVVANVVGAAGFLSFLAAHRPWQVACAYLLVQSGVNAYYTAQRTLITHTVPAAETRAWFAFTGSLRNIGIGAGAALAAAALALFGTGALTWLIAAAAPLYLIAAVCFAGVPTSPPPSPAATKAMNATAKPVAPNAPNAPAASTSPAAPGAPGETPPHTAPPTEADSDSTRRYLLLVACNVPFVLAQSMLSVLIALYATRALGLPAWTASVLLVLNTVMVSTLTSPLTAHAAPSKPRHTITLGYVLLAAAMLAFAAPALPALGSTAWPALLVAIVLFSLAEIFYSPAMNELSVTLTPSAARGSRQSLYQLSWATGNIAAPVLFTTLLDAGALLPWAAQGAACLLALIAVPALEPSRRDQGRPRGRTPRGRTPR
ncbi:MFS transporter [Streptomyces ficellus]|uniref:MFS transporter n=1 Tax=Streptomyces ficellus TaxID=1977088 RepID=A0ABT7Z1K8_9ACTN|nr:MFS transporter [Streptomyces ficellus]MDN3293350.1 MFS transporter [Streptomyces ficellus]